MLAGSSQELLTWLRNVIVNGEQSTFTVTQIFHKLKRVKLKGPLASIVSLSLTLSRVSGRGARSSPNTCRPNRKLQTNEITPTLRYLMVGHGVQYCTNTRRSEHLAWEAGYCLLTSD